MSDITTEGVQRLAKLAGFEMSDLRAETAAARIASLLEELDAIPAEALAGIEPAAFFTVEQPARAPARE